jgi:4-diphosphocytidyl-2-C-methyl-D-erythritol kinase
MAPAVTVGAFFFFVVSCQRLSPCKINLLLNVLGRRSDAFHEIETVLQPVPVHDELEFSHAQSGLLLTCSDPRLPVDERNLVYRAAQAFLAEARIQKGVRIHLEKRIPMEAGLGGGSGNAATTLLGLNELFRHPLAVDRLQGISAALGSDVVFFLNDRPALALGRGERVEWLEPFDVLRGSGLLLVHPGFGVSTPWAYQALGRHPQALAGEPGRGRRLIESLRSNDLPVAAADFYNALEAPVLEKYPLLRLFQEFFREEGALATMMSGSGSSTFAMARDLDRAESLRERFLAKFGSHCWTAVARL